MSAIEAVTLVRQLAEKIKQRDRDQKQSSGANSALIKKLTQMENAYKDSTRQAMPDYNKMLDVAPSIKPLAVKSEAQLMSEAKLQLEKQSAQFKQQLKDKSEAEIDSLEQQQLKTVQSRQNELDKALAAFGNNRQDISDSAIRQGLTHSTIKEGWQQQNTREYLSGFEEINRQYEAKIMQIGRQIEAVNSAKLQSLYEYNLKQASEYEKTLAKLTAEQLKEIEAVNAYNKKALAQQQQRDEQIAALEARWRKEQRQKELAQQETEITEGYSGEKKLEMLNRYNTALEFYKKYEKKEAKRLIEESKEDLRKILGLYYDRLINEINK